MLAPNERRTSGEVPIMFDVIDRRTLLLVLVLIFFNVVIFGCLLLLLTGKVVF
jgi:hypothetical protein